MKHYSKFVNHYDRVLIPNLAKVTKYLFMNQYGDLYSVGYLESIVKYTRGILYLYGSDIYILMGNNIYKNGQEIEHGLSTVLCIDNNYILGISNKRLSLYDIKDNKVQMIGTASDVDTANDLLLINGVPCRCIYGKITSLDGKLSMTRKNVITGYFGKWSGLKVKLV